MCSEMFKCSEKEELKNIDHNITPVLCEYWQIDLKYLNI